MNTATINQQRITLLPMPKEKDDYAFWKKRFLICPKLAGCELAFNTPNFPAAERLSASIMGWLTLVTSSRIQVLLTRVIEHPESPCRVTDSGGVAIKALSFFRGVG
eukprot:Awhi_evm1s6754